MVQLSIYGIVSWYLNTQQQMNILYVVAIIDKML